MRQHQEAEMGEGLERREEEGVDMEEDMCERTGEDIGKKMEEKRCEGKRVERCPDSGQ
jgi:hypothetical protein